MGKINLKLSANVKSKTNFIKLIQWQKWARKEKKNAPVKEKEIFNDISSSGTAFSL